MNRWSSPCLPTAGIHGSRCWGLDSTHGSRQRGPSFWVQTRVNNNPAP